jgi:hypothetical protein
MARLRREEVAAARRDVLSTVVRPNPRAIPPVGSTLQPGIPLGHIEFDDVSRDLAHR